jgi:Holliday junction resolvase RusA-like endonuclease
MQIEFFVAGKPAPGGSKKGFVNPRTGRVVIQDDCDRNGPWMARVAYFARRAYQGEPLEGPVQLHLRFSFLRPKSHYRTGKHSAELRPDAPIFHTSKPDTTKLTRAAEDALKGITWKDDSQVAYQTAEKRYGITEGVKITIRTARA